MLKVQNLGSGYGQVQVLWDVSMEVEEGEFVALVGPNGAGKTTSLRSIAGLLRPMSGSIKFLGKEIGGLPTHEVARMGMSFIPEDMNLFTGMSVRENLLLGAFVVNDRKKSAESLEAILEMFPRLAERRNQMAGTLSGGERKMLAIARGLMASPKILLVDEPSLGLAPKLVVTVFEALQRLSKEGATIFLVEQNVNTTLHITNRAYVLEQGRVTLEGSSRDLLVNDHVQKAYLGLV
ncbi:MAG: ABC transporter ATP-binding protein [Bacillota bacterium]